MEFKKILIVGGGTMGSGIAQVCAQKGMKVLLYDLKEDILKRALDSISWSVGKFIQKGKLKEDKDTIINRIKSVTELKEEVEADIVIEAVFEKLDIKLEVFKRLDEIVSDDTLLASNTSAIPITELASATNRPERIVGLHFFNPAPVMKLLEVVKTIATSDETLELSREFGESLGKTVVIAKDTPGFIVNRLLTPFTLNAIRMLEAEIASRDDIDNAIRLGLGHPMGPLQLADMVGLDTIYYSANTRYEELKEPQYAPPPLLKRMVKAGWLGRKTGRGFYEYE